MPRPRIVKITAKDQAEADAITRALEDPATRAFIVIVGTLQPLSPRGRERVLRYMADRLNEDAGTVEISERAQGGLDVVATGTRALPQARN